MPVVKKKKKPRNYKSEYSNYQGKPAQIKRRSSRNKARRVMMKAGRVRVGDSSDVTHRNGNPMDNKRKNLGVAPKSKNRSYKRTKTSRKVNRKS